MEMLQIFEDLEKQGLKQEHELAENLLFVLQSYLKRKLFANYEKAPLENENDTHDFEITQLIEEEGEIVNINVQNNIILNQEEALDIVTKKETSKTADSDSPGKNSETEVGINETSELDPTEPAKVKVSSGQVKVKVELTDDYIESVQIKTKKELAENESVLKENESKKELRENKAKQRSMPNNTRMKHLISNAGAVTSSCEHCSYSLEDKEKIGKYTRTKIRRHKRDCHFVCEVCKNMCESKGELETHMKNVHTSTNGESLCGINGCITTATATDSMSTWFKTGLDRIINHVEKVHDKIKYICKICNQPYRNWPIHKRLHEVDPSELKTCTLCDLNFISIITLNNHNNKVHPKPQFKSTKGDLKCEKCSYETWKPVNFITHKASHTKDGEIKCEECQFNTKSNYVFRRHMAKEHSVGELYRCSTCPYTTTTVNHFNSHVSRHTKEKQMMCDQCEYRTSVTTDLKRHIRSAHSNQPPKYVCDQCEYKSSDSGNFYAHKKSIHGSEVHQCEFCEYSTRSIRSFRGHKAKRHSADQSKA